MTNGRLVLVEKDFRPVGSMEDALYDRVYARAFDKMLDRRDSLRAQKSHAWDLRLAEGASPETVEKQKQIIKRLNRIMFMQRQDVEDYKDQTARDFVLPLHPSIESQYREFGGETIGKAVRAGTHRVGSREWLEERQFGMGGSDIGKAIGLAPAIFSRGRQQESIEADWDELYSSKVLPISDEDVEQQLPEEGPLFRGNAWEPIIFQRFMRAFPDLELMHTKSTWRNGHATLNVDGLLSSGESGDPDGIFEAKTGSYPEMWNDGIPLGYLAQVTHYMYRMDLSYAYVSVLLDDQEMRTYEVELDDVSIPCEVFPNGGSPKQIADYADKCYELFVKERAKLQEQREDEVA